MARFGIERPSFGLTGETFQRQGVVDNSKATMINAVAEQVVPVATAVQSQNLVNDLNEIDQEFEGQLGQPDPDTANPAVQGFEAELKRLNGMRNKISESQYEARKNAALKRRINQTPGLAGALNRTASQFDALNEYSLVQQAFAAQESAQDQFDELKDFGVNKLGLPPTWTQDPNLVKYAEWRSKQHMQAASDQDYKTSLEVMKTEMGLTKDIQEKEMEVNGRIVANGLTTKFVDTLTNGYNLGFKQEDGTTLNINAMDAVQVGNLPVEQRIALARQLKTDFLAEQTLLTAQVNDGTLKPEQFSGHLDNMAKMYNTMIGFTNLEDEAALITQEDTVLSRDNMALGRQVTALDLQMQATQITYNMEELDRTRALEIQQKELDLVNGLVTSGATAKMLENPAVLRWKVLNTLGLVDPKSAGAQRFMDKLTAGGIDNEREAALQTGDFAAWQAHMADKTGIYRRMRVDLATPASASVVAADTASTIAQVQKAVKDPLRPMDMDEVADVMNIFTSDNYGQVVEKYREQFGDVGVEMEKVVAPIIARDFVTKATNLYASGGNDFNPLLTMKDGQFAIGDKPVAGAITKADDNAARIVKGLNNTAKAIANTQGISLEEANQKVLQMIPQERMYNLMDSNIRNTIRVGSLEEYMAKEQEVRTAFNNLYGDGAYLDYHRKDLTSQGYVEVGPTANGNGIIFQSPNGKRKVVGE